MSGTTVWPRLGPLSHRRGENCSLGVGNLWSFLQPSRSGGLTSPGGPGRGRGVDLGTGCLLNESIGIVGKLLCPPCGLPECHRPLSHTFGLELSDKSPCQCIPMTPRKDEHGEPAQTFSQLLCQLPVEATGDGAQDRYGSPYRRHGTARCGLVVVRGENVIQTDLNKKGTYWYFYCSRMHIT